MDRLDFYRRVPDLFLAAHNKSWERYEETIFHMRRPVTHGNYNRVRLFVGTNMASAALLDEREFPELDRILRKAKYPRVGHLTRLHDFAGGSTELATALLHFNNPAYPIYDAFTVRGLNLLGYPIPFVKELTEEASHAYQAFVNQLEQFKQEIPFYCVPEKNYYLQRILQMTLWELGVSSPATEAEAAAQSATTR